MAVEWLRTAGPVSLAPGLLHKTQEPIETDKTPSTVDNTAQVLLEMSHEQPTSAVARGLDDESDTEQNQGQGASARR